MTEETIWIKFIKEWGRFSVGTVANFGLPKGRNLVVDGTCVEVAAPPRTEKPKAETATAEPNAETAEVTPKADPDAKAKAKAAKAEAKAKAAKNK